VELALASGGTVNENAAAGTVAGQMTARDPDAGDTLSYELLDDAGGRFAIDAATGTILVAEGASLDFETQAFHDLTVAVRDAGGLETTTRVRISVANLNEAPSAPEFSWGGDVVEGSAAGVAVGQVRAIDPDAGDRPT
jgi:VCBS repeat-containing protein